MELFSQFLHWMIQVVDVIRHLDVHLNEWIRALGPSIYGVLSAIIFCETGLVVTPFLPGDSLLFALGALTVGDDAALSLPLLIGLLTVAAIVGDAVNYAIGRRLGPKMFSSRTSKLFSRTHLEKTQSFYEKYGGKTIIFARFVPIVRTFAPFVAGIGNMKYSRFAMFNVVGGVTWVVSFLVLGRLFGNLPGVKQNFHFVIFGIIIVSLLPAVVEWFRARTPRTPRKKASAAR